MADNPLEVMASEIAEDLVRTGYKLQALRDASKRLQTEQGPKPELSFNRYRRQLSSLANLSLGRMGKLTLDASVSKAAIDTWTELQHTV